MPVRVMVVDDESDVRTGLAELLATQAGFVVVGAVASAREAGELMDELPVDLVVVDLVLGEGPDGIQLTKSIKARFPLLPVLVLSGRDESLFAERALVAGASGFVMKDQAAEVLFDAIHTVLHHGVWLSAGLRERLLPTSLVRADVSSIRDELSQRVISEVRRGNRTVDGLARALAVPLHAVEHALEAIQLDLRLPTRSALWLFLR